MSTASNNNSDVNQLRQRWGRKTTNAEANLHWSQWTEATPSVLLSVKEANRYFRSKTFSQTTQLMKNMEVVCQPSVMPSSFSEIPPRILLRCEKIWFSPCSVEFRIYKRTSIFFRTTVSLNTCSSFILLWLLYHPGQRSKKNEPILQTWWKPVQNIGQRHLLDIFFWRVLSMLNWEEPQWCTQNSHEGLYII